VHQRERVHQERFQNGVTTHVYDANQGSSYASLTYNADGTYNTNAATGWGAGYYTSCVGPSISTLYAQGQAYNFIGNNGLGSNAQGDRITSGTLVAVANSATGYISLTTGSTTWGYLSSGVNYLPSLQTSTLSATVISATAIQLVSQTTSPIACNTGNSGTLRYNSPTTTLELCNGNGWQPMGVGIPAGTISAFASTTCPTGWSEYTAARGRFLRGIDNGAGNDPDGTRSPGATQADMVGPHTHGFSTSGGNTGSGAAIGAGFSAQGYSGSGGTVASNGTAETRPKNIAVTFCQFNGTSNGWNNPLSGGSTTPGGSTADVQINSGGAFGADSGNFTYSSSTLKTPNVTVSGNVSAATVTVSQNSTGCTSANVGTFRRNPTTNRVEICE
jgi:hypothetical protein